MMYSERKQMSPTITFSFSTAVTLILSRSTKSNQFFAMSQLYKFGKNTSTGSQDFV